MQHERNLWAAAAKRGAAPPEQRKLDMVMKTFTERIGAEAAENARAMEAKLDAALADTFPASDPVSISPGDPPRSRTADHEMAGAEDLR